MDIPSLVVGFIVGIIFCVVGAFLLVCYLAAQFGRKNEEGES